MKKIHKYELEVDDKQRIEMPKGSEILSVQGQSGIPVLWAMVDTEEKGRYVRIIEIFGTGNDIPENMGIERTYIGTFQLTGGAFIGHVFERIN